MNERAQRTLEKDYRKKITVRTEHDRDFNVIASIEDNGTGIPEENLKKIFEPFFTTKEVGKGAGLGLAIIYGLVKEHKGTVEVKSELGVGCKFILKFPPVI
jgi:signal transduction histidine kinase